MENKLRLNKKGALGFAILFLVVFGLWNFFRSYMLFLGLLLIVDSVVFSAWLLWRDRDKIRAQISLPPDRAGRNTAFSFCIRVENPGRFAGFTAEIVYGWGNLFTGYREQGEAHLWAAPGGGEIRQLLSSRYAGRVEARIEEFRVYDLFRIFCLTGCEREGADVLVRPGFDQAEDQSEIYSCVEGFPGENESRKKGMDYNPEYEVREYIPGDELKSIHWKLSAKQGELMVRERLAAGRDKVNVLLPLGDDRQYNDGLIEALYGLCRLLLNKEYPIQLYWPESSGHEGNMQGCSLRGRFVTEQGELENVLSEILSGCGLHGPGLAEEQMSIEHPGENYIRIQTGEYKGAYIH